MKSLFVSDVHLGSALTKKENDAIEQRFLEWLNVAHSERARVFLLGDIFDFWFEYKFVIPDAYSAVLGRLKEMVNDGIEIHFFKGNHDMWLRNFLSDEIGLIVHSRSSIIEIDGEKVFMGHGHDLCFKRTLTTRLLWIFFSTKFLYDLFSTILHPNFMMRIGRLWSRASRSNKNTVSHVFKAEDEYITRYITNLLPDFKKQGVNKFIFGHFHSPTLYTLCDGESQLMILGEWSEANVLFGEMDGGELKAQKLEVKH